jgi:manganese/zinc/iron transport system substrate-binding protein
MHIRFLLLLMLLAVGGCSAAPADQRPTVVVTTQQLADAVGRIGADRIRLTPLLSAGVDPHSYVPTAGDLRKLAEADLIIAHGLNLEAQLLDVLTQMDDNGTVQVLLAGETLPTADLIAVEPGVYDPHIWHDALLWQQVAAAIGAALSELDPAGADDYRIRLVSFQAELTTVDNDVRALIQAIPPERRVLVTAHDAFAYFGRAYGLEVAAIQGISTVSEASANEISALADLILQRQVPAIFVESSVSPRTIEALQAAVQSTGAELQIGGELYADAMGAAGSATATYVGMLRQNAETISSALRGEEWSR